MKQSQDGNIFTQTGRWRFESKYQKLNIKITEDEIVNYTLSISTFKEVVLMKKAINNAVIKSTVSSFASAQLPVTGHSMKAAVLRLRILRQWQTRHFIRSRRRNYPTWITGGKRRRIAVQREYNRFGQLQ
jgi:hypothetical protein